MQVKDLIAEKLAAAFAPQSLDVMDKSHQHEATPATGPAANPFQGSYRVGGVPRKEPDRAPPHDQPDTFGELAAGVHALAIHASAPGEG